MEAFRVTDRLTDSDPATHLPDVKTTQSSLVRLGASKNKSTGFRPTEGTEGAGGEDHGGGGVSQGRYRVWRAQR